EQGSNGAVAKALEMAEADPSYYMPYQYGNEANPLAHYHGTAVEILEELDDVAAFAGGLGTGGALMGCGRRLKEENPESLILAVGVAQGLDDGNVVFVVPDDGWKYLSSGVYTKTIEELEGSLESASFW